MDELLLKFFDGNATTTEEKSIQSWIETNDYNQAYYHLFAESWRECSVTGNQLLFSSIAAIQ